MTLDQPFNLLRIDVCISERLCVAHRGMMRTKCKDASENTLET